MKLAWDVDFRKVILEIDSKIMLELLEKMPPDSPHYNQMMQIRRFRKQQWECKLQHQWREGNHSADHLANLSINNSDLGGKFLVNPPIYCDLLNKDLTLLL